MSADLKKLLLMALVLFAALFAFFSVRESLVPGTSSSAPGQIASLQKKWEFTLGERVDGGLAFSDDGAVIAACQDGLVYAVDSNGTLRWKTFVGATVASPAIGPDGAVYVANNNGAVFALNHSGSLRWRSVVYEGSTFGHNGAALGRDFLYLPSRNGLKAVSLADGKVAWSAGLGTEQWGSVTLLTDGTILFAGRGRLNAVDSQGEIMWQYPPLTREAIEQNNGLPPPAQFHVPSGIVPGPDRQVFVSANESKLVAVGLDGTVRWEFQPTRGRMNQSSPIIAADGTVYFEHGNGNLYALDSYGTQKWNVNLRFYSDGTPMLAADGTIFAIGGTTLYAISPSGQILAEAEIGTNGPSSPTLGPDGTIYLVNGYGKLEAFAGGHGGLMQSPWPKFQADLANTGNARL